MFYDGNKCLLTQILVCFFIFANSDRLHSEDRNVEITLLAGVEAYNKKQFRVAKNIFDELTRLKPDCSECYHMKGKSYGRLAENSSWLKAIKYAPKALESFEAAYRLAPREIDIIEDLISFYSKAPFFLGGDVDKAKKLAVKLKELKLSKHPD